MKKLILAFTFLAGTSIPGLIWAQQTKPGTEKILVIAEQMPAYPGGEAALKAHFKNALAAHTFTKGGYITLSMVIDKSGQPKNIEVSSGLNPETDAIVLEKARKMPRWEPGKQNGKPVSVRTSFQVTVTTPADEEARKKNEDLVYTFVEQQAEFPGGEKALIEYLAKNLKYPAEAQKNKIEGVVFLSFIVGKDGELREPKILKSPSPDLDTEVFRLIKNMPNWKPGKQNGQAVNVRYTLPIRFKLEEPAEKK